VPFPGIWLIDQLLVLLHLAKPSREGEKNLQQLAPALKITVLLTVLTGLVYPGIITGLCQVFFRDQANGSLVVQNGQIIGSSLLAQNFTRPEYFHPRPSAAGSDGYDPTASSGSNLGPTSQKLYDRVKTSAEQFRKDNPDYTGPIPAVGPPARETRQEGPRKKNPPVLLGASNPFVTNRCRI
jgi:K+-transporting ATPase, c chain